MCVPLALVNPLLAGPSLLANPAAPVAPLDIVVEVNTTTSLCSMSIETD